MISTLAPAAISAPTRVPAEPGFGFSSLPDAASGQTAQAPPLTVSDAAAAAEMFDAARVGLRGLHEAKVVTVDNVSLLTTTVAQFTAGAAFTSGLANVPEQAVTALRGDVTNLQAMEQAFTSSSRLEITPELDKQLSVAHADAERAAKLLTS